MTTTYIPRPTLPWPPAPALRWAAPACPSFSKSSSSTLPKSNSHLMSNGLPKSDNPPSTHPPLRTDTGKPAAAGRVWAENFPHIQLEGKAGTDVLSALPAKRVPTIVRKFKVDTKPQNLAAWFIQATGVVLPRGKACTRCAEGHGVFGPTCVVMLDGEMGSRTLNTCANCCYNRMGFCCSVRVGERKRQLTNPRPDLVVRHWSGKKKAPAALAPPAAQGSIVHPAYVSSSNTASSWEPFPGAAAAAAATPARESTPVYEPVPDLGPTHDHNPEFPTTAFDLLTSVGHPPPIPVATAPPKSLPPPPPPSQVKLSSSPPTTVLLANSLDRKVESWEKRYENMCTTELVEMQRVLMERLEDTTMRMVAMQKVLAGRLAGSR